MRKDTTPVVDAISQLNFEGNIIPHSWLQSPVMHLDSGLVNLPAIVLLSDLIYWYRAVVDRDEYSGNVVCIRKKFSGDKLQKTYAVWGESLGLSKGQVQDGIYFLKARGLITVELRTIESGFGKVPNVPFIEPVPEEIQEITYPVDKGHTSRQNGRGLPFKREIPPATTGDKYKRLQQEITEENKREERITFGNSAQARQEEKPRQISFSLPEKPQALAKLKPAPPVAKTRTPEEVLFSLQNSPLADAGKNPLLWFRQLYAIEIGMIPDIPSGSYGRWQKELKRLIATHGKEEVGKRLLRFLRNGRQAEYGYGVTQFTHAFDRYAFDAAASAGRGRGGRPTAMEQARTGVQALARISQQETGEDLSW